MNTIFDTRHCLSVAEIRDYRHGYLSAASQHDVEKHLLDCPLCSTAVAHYERASDTRAVEQDLRALQYEVERKATDLTSRAPQRRQRFLGRNRTIAVVLLCFTLFASWIYWEHTSYDRLFTAHFAPTLSTMSQPGTADGVEPSAALREAEIAYQQEDYVVAANHFEAHLTKHPDDFAAMYQVGISYLALDQTTRAIHWLERARINDIRLYETASWHLALAQLKARQLSDARLTLQELIAGGNGDYQSEATRLLQEIRE